MLSFDPEKILLFTIHCILLHTMPRLMNPFIILEEIQRKKVLNCFDTSTKTSKIELFCCFGQNKIFLKSGIVSKDFH